jgi:surface polysaccharide O-acyltransferase-like enzyme
MARSLDSSTVSVGAGLLPEQARGLEAGSTATGGREHNRVLAIDAVRGTAMLFVGISHTRYYVGADHHIASLLKWIGYLAAPAFLLVSGIACGYQYSKSTSRETVGRIVDRGLFVLVVGHILVCLSLWFEVKGNVFEHIVITDTIGLCICLSPLVRHLSARQLIVEGIAVFLVTCLVAAFWQPSSAPGKLFGALLFSIDSNDLRARGWVTPTVAYFGFFLIGMGIGRLIGERQAGKVWRLEGLASRLVFAGTVAVAAAVTVNVLRHFAKPSLLEAIASGGQWASALLKATDVRQQLPPMPAYAAYYCGIAIAGLGGVMRLLQRAPTPLLAGPVQVAAVVGRASFISYVVVQWLVDFLPHWIGFGAVLTPVSALLYLALVMAVVFLIAGAWDRMRANRYLTFGLISAR